MRVVSPSDGFNLYRGGLELAGAQPGWKWLDIEPWHRPLPAISTSFPGRRRTDNSVPDGVFIVSGRGLGGERF